MNLADKLKQGAMIAGLASALSIGGCEIAMSGLVSGNPNITLDQAMRLNTIARTVDTYGAANAAAQNARGTSEEQSSNALNPRLNYMFASDSLWSDRNSNGKIDANEFGDIKTSFKTGEKLYIHVIPNVRRSNGDDFGAIISVWDYQQNRCLGGLEVKDPSEKVFGFADKPWVVFHFPLALTRGKYMVRSIYGRVDLHLEKFKDIILTIE